MKGEREMSRIMKPKLGQKIYMLYRNGIYEENVVMLGADAFAHSSCFDSSKEDSYRKPLWYSAYGTTWFTNLLGAKEALLKSWYDKYPNLPVTIKKDAAGGWELHRE